MVVNKVVDLDHTLSDKVQQDHFEFDYHMQNFYKKKTYSMNFLILILFIYTLLMTIIDERLLDY